VAKLKQAAGLTSMEWRTTQGQATHHPVSRYRILLVRPAPCLRTCKCLESACWEPCGLCALGLLMLAVCSLLSFTVGLYELCASRVSEVLRNKVHRTEEAQHVDFYAFSYYYDLAASFGLIGKGQDNLGRGPVLASSGFVGMCEVSGLRGQCDREAGRSKPLLIGKQVPLSQSEGTAAASSLTVCTAWPCPVASAEEPLGMGNHMLSF
jgi:hypothetical protein